VTSVDWNKPLEAVHESGRVVSMRRAINDDGPDSAGEYEVYPDHGIEQVFFRADGTHVDEDHGGCPWRIRNRSPDKFAENAENSQPLISLELQARMVALVRRCADSAMASGDLYTMREATAIVAELPQPVDPDLLEAREVAIATVGDRDWPQVWAKEVRAGQYDRESRVRVALAAIKRGRELAERERKV